MKYPNKARGARRIKPMVVNKTRHKTDIARNTPPNMIKATLNMIPKILSQSQLVVKRGFISALSTMKNADLIVKLSERFSKRDKNK